MTADTVLEPGMVLNVDMTFTEIGWDTVHITTDCFEALTGTSLDIVTV